MTWIQSQEEEEEEEEEEEGEELDLEFTNCAGLWEYLKDLVWDGKELDGAEGVELVVLTSVINPELGEYLVVRVMQLPSLPRRSQPSLPRGRPGEGWGDGWGEGRSGLVRLVSSSGAEGEYDGGKYGLGVGVYPEYGLGDCQFQDTPLSSSPYLEYTLELFEKV